MGANVCVDLMTQVRASDLAFQSTFDERPICIDEQRDAHGAADEERLAATCGTR